MAGSVNKVILVGRLGKDPEIRSIPSGNSVAKFSLATDDRFTDKIRREAGTNRVAQHRGLGQARGDLRPVSAQGKPRLHRGVHQDRELG